jgi:hypothetical protein
VRLPDFLIIGAAKAGTTAVARHLGEHPEIFVPELKELCFFAFDPDRAGPRRFWDDSRHPFPVRTLEEYGARFAELGGARLAGEGSPLYMESEAAPARIRAALPDVKLIALLRQPAERAWSGYLMNRLQNREPEADPCAALTPGSRYVQVSRYADALERYLALFPREQLRVVLFDALRADTGAVMRELYAWLGADPEFRPDLETRHNEGGAARSGLLNAVVNNQALRYALGPRAPEPLRLGRGRRRPNPGAPPPLPPELRAALTHACRDDILRTQDLIGRDLSHWLVD